MFVFFLVGSYDYVVVIVFGKKMLVIVVSIFAFSLWSLLSQHYRVSQAMCHAHIPALPSFFFPQSSFLCSN